MEMARGARKSSATTKTSLVRCCWRRSPPSSLRRATTDCYGRRGLPLAFCQFLRLLSDQFCQPRNLPQPTHPIPQVRPETHPQLPARLLQAGERVSAASPHVVARAAAYLPRLRVTANDRRNISITLGRNRFFGLSLLNNPG